MISIGKDIQDVVLKIGMKHSFFAQSINMTERNAYNLFNRDSLDTNQLFAISRLLKYDFFKQYSQALKDEVPELNISEETEGAYLKGEKKKHRIMIEVELDDLEYKELLKRTGK